MKSLRNGEDLSVVRLSHRNGQKFRRTQEITNNLRNRKLLKPLNSIASI